VQRKLAVTNFSLSLSLNHTHTHSQTHIFVVSVTYVNNSFHTHSPTHTCSLSFTHMNRARTHTYLSLSHSLSRFINVSGFPPIFLARAMTSKYNIADNKKCAGEKYSFLFPLTEKSPLHYLKYWICESQSLGGNLYLCDVKVFFVVIWRKHFV